MRFVHGSERTDGVGIGFVANLGFRVRCPKAERIPRPHNTSDEKRGDQF